jgi:formylmethanofuran dehydrogenase subunit D
MLSNKKTKLKKAKLKKAKQLVQFSVWLLLFVVVQPNTFAQNNTQVSERKTDAKPKIQKIAKRKGPLVIQSQVKGSQEQPNVIYIMPWQGIDNPITINNNKRSITLPTFKPINPKVFKAQVARFAKNNATEFNTETNTTKSNIKQ